MSQTQNREQDAHGSHQTQSRDTGQNNLNLAGSDCHEKHDIHQSHGSHSSFSTNDIHGGFNRNEYDAERRKNQNGDTSKSWNSSPPKPPPLSLANGNKEKDNKTNNPYGNQSSLDFHMAAYKKLHEGEDSEDNCSPEESPRINPNKWKTAMKKAEPKKEDKFPSCRRLEEDQNQEPKVAAFNLSKPKRFNQSKNEISAIKLIDEAADDGDLKDFEKLLKREIEIEDDPIAFIQNWIDENKTFDHLKEYLSHSKFNGIITEKDIKTAEATYIDYFLKTLPDKGKDFIWNVVEKSDESDILKWIKIIYGNGTKQELLDLFETSKFYDSLKFVMKRQNESPKIASFFHNMRVTFRHYFKASTRFNGLLGIYRLLLCCKNERSPVVCEAVKVLWRKLFGTDAIVASTTDEVDEEHNLLDKIVQDFTSDLETNDKYLMEQIKLMFEPITFKTENDGKNLVVSGHMIKWSEISTEFFKNYDASKIELIALCADDSLIMDENIKFAGKILCMISKSTEFPQKITCVLSGEDGTDDENLKIPAKSGEAIGENGEPGEDGNAGGSSGRLAIYTKNLINKENLFLVINGGNGSNGQDGGNGQDGKKGEEKKFDEVFDSSYFTALESGGFGNVLSAGLKDRIYSEYVNNSDVFHSKSSYWLSTHVITVHHGKEGEPGGRGGTNGNGGEGGKKGDYIVQCDGHPVHLENVTAFNGKDGTPGKPGLNGKHGLDGCDVGVTYQYFGSTKEYGKSNNEKLEVVFEDNGNSDSIYVSNGDHYARIESSEIEPQSLQEHEKTAETKCVSERKGNAIARKTNDINMAYVKQKYDEICHAEHNHFKQDEDEEEQEIEAEAEAEAKISRVMEIPDFNKNEIYDPKRRHKTYCVSADALKNGNVEDICKGIVLPQYIDLLKHCSNENSSENVILKKKLLLTLLRNERLKLDSKVTEDFMEEQQYRVRNFAPFLKKGSEGKVVSPCVGALCGNPHYSNLIKKSKESIEIFSPSKFSKYISTYNELQKIKIAGEPIFDSLSKIQAVFNAVLDKNTKENVFKYLEKLLKKTTIASSFQHKLHELIEELDLGHIISEKFRTLPQEFQNDKTKFLFLFVYLNNKVLSNRVLAEALSSFIKEQAEDSFIKENFELFDENATVNAWLAEIENNKDMCQKALDDIVECGTKCAAGRLLLAWETKSNIRIYNNGSLVEDHLPWHISNVHHLEIDEQTGECTPLSINKDRVALESERIHEIEAIKTCIQKFQNENNCESLLSLETLNVAESCSYCETKRQGTFSVDQCGEIQEKLKKLLSYFGDNDKLYNILYEKLEDLCHDSPSIGIAFIDSLLTVFEVEGCFIDLSTFKYLLETVSDTSQTYRSQNEQIFPSMLFKKQQSDWIDEFFIFNVESYFKASISQKEELRKSVTKIADENLKILFSQKLKNEQITLDEFFEIIALLKGGDDIYPILTALKLKHWPHVIKKYQMPFILKNKTTHFLDEKQREKAIFWCSELANHFGIEEVEAVYELLGRQKKLIFEDKIFGQLVWRLCKNEIVCDIKSSKLKGIFAETIRRCSKDFDIADIDVIQNDIEIVDEIMNDSSAGDYSTEEWMKLLNKKNETCDELLNISRLFSSPLPEAIQKSIVECVNKLKNSDGPEKCMKIFKELFDKLEYPNKDFDYFLLEIVSEVIFQNRGFHLRLNQKFATLCAIKSEGGLLQQLETGEGKSLILTALSIIKVLKGESVNIITSSSVLAKRDTECNDPVGCTDIYRVFGIKASHVCISSPKIRAERYANSHIIYGDISTFQLDELSDKFLSTNIIGNRKFDNVLVDEVDSLLIDKASNMLYLSHGLAELESLQSLLVKIMYTVENGIKTGSDDEAIYDHLYQKLFNDDEVDKIEIPTHLKEYVKMHLKELLDSAKEAYFMEEGVDYVVDIVHSNVSIDLLPKIVIIDRGTGVDLPTTQWGKGVHQFVQLRHAVKFDAISKKAVFISNVTYLKRFKNLYGFTGTLGSQAERKQLCDAHHLKCISLPSSRPKQFYEEASIVTTTEDSHIEELFNSAKEKVKQNRSVLIICESSKEVDEMYQKMRDIAEKSLSGEDLKSFKEACLYRREHEKFDYGEGKELETGKIIFATNLAGRGADIKISKELRKHGGLHVITSFLPENLRIQEQAFGRASRGGDPGSAQMIIFVDKNEYGKNGHISKLKAKRDAREFLKTESVQEYYKETIVVEEKCLVHFSEAFKNLENTLDHCLCLNESAKELAKKDLTDQWAYYLDRSALQGMTAEQRIEDAKNFCQNLKLVDDNGNLMLTQPMNILKYGILKALCGHYSDAETLFKKFIDEHPFYATEAKLYLCFIKAVTNDYEEAEKLMEEVRNGCQKKMNEFYNDLSIIDYYKKHDGNRLFKTDAFSQQQQDKIQLLNIFLNENVLGERLDATDFSSHFFTEENSIHLYNFLTDQNFINRSPLKANYSVEKLTEYCHLRGIPVDTMKGTLEDFKNEKINQDQLIIALNPPNVEKFWDQLKKKELITDTKKHLFIDSSKLSNINMETVKLFEELIKHKSKVIPEHSKRIFEHIYVLNETWQELDFELFNKEYSDKLPDKTFKILQQMNVICVTESAEFIKQDKKDLASISFDEFGSISNNAFLNYGYSQEENDKILKELVEKKILHKLNSNNYEMSFADTSDEKQKVFETLEPKIRNILNQNFIFTSIYHGLQEKFDDLKKDENLQINLPTFKNCSPVRDLIWYGIFEESNVTKKALDKELLSTAIQEFAKEFSLTIDDITINDVYKILYQKAKVIYKFETPDAKLIPLDGKLPEYNLVDLKFSSLMVAHGPSHLIAFEEKRWSASTIKKLVGVLFLAVAELVLGGVITICSSGAMTFASGFCFDEALSDLIYGIQGFYSGYADSYLHYKTHSLITDGVLCGIGGFFAYGGKMNPIAYALKGTGWSTNGINHVGLKGAALVKELGLKVVLKQLGKQILRRVGESFAHIALFHILQKSLHGIIDDIIEKVKEKILGELKEVMGNLGSMQNLFHKVFTKLGIDEGRKLISECARRVFHNQTWIAQVCNFVLLQYRQAFMNVIYGIAAGKNHCQKIMSQLFCWAVDNLPVIFNLAQWGELIYSMRNKVKSYMKDIENSIKTEYKAKKKIMKKQEELAPKSRQDESINSSNKVMVEKATFDAIQEIHKQMGDILSQSLQTRVVDPLLAMAASKIQNKLQQTISKLQNEHREKLDLKKFKKLKRKHNSTKRLGLTESELKVAWDEYERKLLNLQKNTRSVAVYVKILQQGVKIDQIGAGFVANYISSTLKQSVVVNIKNKDGTTYTHSAGKSDKNVKVVNIDFANQHYGSKTKDQMIEDIKSEFQSQRYHLSNPSKIKNLKKYEKKVIKKLQTSSEEKCQRDFGINLNSRNNCLREAILMQVPELKEHCSNENVFRRGLGQSILKDPYARQVIQNGWHSCPIEKKLIGGHRLPMGDWKRCEKLIGGNQQVMESRDNFKTIKVQCKSFIDEYDEKFSGIPELQQKKDGFVKVFKNKLDELQKHGIHKDMKDLNELKQKMKDLQSLFEKGVDNLISDLPNPDIAKQRNMDHLYQRLGIVNKAKQINSNSTYKVQYRPLNEWIERWNKSVDKCPSLETREKLANVHFNPSQRPHKFSMKPEARICEKLATHLQKNAKFLSPSNDNNDDGPGKHTVAVLFNPYDKSVNISANYFNEKQGRALLDKEKEMFVDEAILKFGAKFISYGAERVNYVERDPSTRPLDPSPPISRSSFKENIWDKKEDEIKKNNRDE